MAGRFSATMPSTLVEKSASLRIAVSAEAIAELSFSTDPSFPATKLLRLSERRVTLMSAAFSFSTELSFPVDDAVEAVGEARHAGERRVQLLDRPVLRPTTLLRLPESSVTAAIAFRSSCIVSDASTRMPLKPSLCPPSAAVAFCTFCSVFGERLAILVVEEVGEPVGDDDGAVEELGRVLEDFLDPRRRRGDHRIAIALLLLERRRVAHAAADLHVGVAGDALQLEARDGAFLDDGGPLDLDPDADPLDVRGVEADLVDRVRSARR